MNFKPGDRVTVRKGVENPCYSGNTYGIGEANPVFSEPQTIKEIVECGHCVKVEGQSVNIPIAALTLCEPEAVAAANDVCICAVGRSRYCTVRHYGDPEPDTPTVRAQEGERPFRVKATIGFKVRATDAEAARRKVQGKVAMKGEKYGDVEIREVEVGAEEEL